MIAEEVVFICPKCMSQVRGKNISCPVCGLDNWSIETDAKENKENRSNKDFSGLTTKSWVNNGNIFIERKSSINERILIYLKDLCVGCGICAEGCPRECIEMNIPLSETGQPLITIDPDLCFLCGICSELCLFKAIDIKSDGKSLKGLNGVPIYSPLYEVNTSKCPPGCIECETVCPMGAIEIDSTGYNRECTKCIYCGNCSVACPEDAIAVEKIFSGNIEINLEKCQGCGVCLETCPSKAIEFPKFKIEDDVELIKVVEETCIYCGACEQICPVEAITINRTEVNFSFEGKSPWTKTHKEAFKKILKH